MVELRNELFPESTDHLNYETYSPYGYKFYKIIQLPNGCMVNTNWYGYGDVFKIVITTQPTFTSELAAQFFIDLFLY